MENNIINFDWNGSNISFELSGNGTMINATEMAKAFGKRPSKWLELPSTKEFINIFLNIRKLDIEDLIKTERGGSNFGKRHGTWMHEDIAIEFAR